MGIIKTKGIIIQESNMGDFDKMLTILTPGYGKISCAARGARRPKSSLMAATQYLCFGDYVLFKGTNTYNINACDTIEVFYNLRMDLDKLNCAVEMAKLTYSVTNENENSYEILQLLLNSLYILSETNKNMDLILAIFKLRLASIIGFRPDVSGCKSCKTNEDLIYFSFKDNGFKCGICAKLDKSTIQISPATKDAIKYIVLAPPKKLFSFNIPENCIKELSIVAKVYLEDKVSF